eukprot:286198-Prymnesium_polylepis.1
MSCVAGRAVSGLMSGGVGGARLEQPRRVVACEGVAEQAIEAEAHPFVRVRAQYGDELLLPRNRGEARRAGVRRGAEGRGRARGGVR